MSSNKAPIAITMGDPSGIGPEIALRTAVDQTLPVQPIIIGDVALLQNTANALGLQAAICDIEKPETKLEGDGIIRVLQVGAPLKGVPIGQVNAQSGQAAFNYIRTAIELAKENRIAAIVTAPIHKEALAAAHIKYPGHTEILAEFAAADNVAMMLANEHLRVILVTIHCSLREAIERITHDRVLKTIQLAHEGMQKFALDRPRIAVAGLNPHAGENGLFGHEEIEIISPAIMSAQQTGIDVSGPWPADTIFMQAREGLFDIVVAQYHDQGLIPVKYLGLEEGVNITLGLPFIRTSPDHGTAFDIAGQGIASSASLRTAVIYAHRLAKAHSPLSTANKMT